MKRLAVVLFSFVLGCIASPAWSATLYVDATNSSGIEDGTQQSPFNTIMEGITAAAAGDTVSVAPGIYYGRVTFVRPVSLVSQGGPQNTIIDGAGDYVCLYWVRLNATSGPTEHNVEGFTLTNGDTLAYAWQTAYINIRNCIFKNAVNGFQAGMAVGVNIYNSVFTNLSGKAIYSFWNPGPTLYNVTIDNVTTAAFVAMTPLRMTNTTITNAGTVFDFQQNPAFIGHNVNIWNYSNYFSVPYDLARFWMYDESSADPLFANAPVDYRLKAGSPLIDAGIDVGLPYEGAAPDIGAYEYGNLTIPELLANLAEAFADAPVGTLLSPEENRQHALHMKLEATLKAVYSLEKGGKAVDRARVLNGCLQKLTNDILQRTDGNHGGNLENDWILDSAEKTEFYNNVMSLIQVVEAELAAINSLQ